ncbi:MAG: bifunctional hydroxymethylpyrimidine kinase/phosphomethylpyrimidine kinase [Verrucomicrobiales bacterium]|jgi:hydroxymethylpyrimidine/phosphomethylpyrimidine kinase|nr:bifunctional hydroxymethylpyrimidine kinase/phosphomethylpyrimidine kinase [Verrucomicrobiales bacterium]
MARQSFPVALTVAGSDNSGGAGIQADLKTFTSLGVFGTTAVTCVVAENPARVASVTPVPPREVQRQMDLVFEAFPVGAMKTGMLYSKEIIRAVAKNLRTLTARTRPRLVVDPVMVATSGALLLKRDAARVLMDELLPLASLVTPNLDEAAVLLGRNITTLDEMESAAVDCHQIWGVPFLIKGGHLRTGGAIDLLYDGQRVCCLESPRNAKLKPHGAGCTYSAAIASLLALKKPLVTAVSGGKQFIANAIHRPLTVGKYQLLNQLP